MFREDFLILKNNLIYFDNGATTLKPNKVIESISDYYTNYPANTHRGDYKISIMVDEKINETRDNVKSFINASTSDEIIFTSGTTEGINIIANGFFGHHLENGDEIILSKADHASNLLPWFKLATELNLVIKFVDLDDNYFITLDSIKKLVTKKTKVIALASISNVIGDLRPIKEITQFAHQNDIFVVVDAAQSIGHIKTNVSDLDVDFLVFSGHKMCGPTGIGVLYGKYELLNEISPINLGGGMNESFDEINNVLLKSLPLRLEAGTPNIAGIIGLNAAINYITNIGLDEIHQYEMKLREYFINELAKISHVDIINIESDTGIIAFNIEGIFSQDVAIYLDKYNICVRAGNHCTKLLKDITKVRNTIRVSLYFYNTFEEIDTFIELITDKEKILREML